MIRRLSKLVYVNSLGEPKKDISKRVVATEGVSHVPRYCGDSKDTEGKSCPLMALWRCSITFPWDKEAECNGVGYTIARVAHLPVRKAIVLFLPPLSCECEKITYSCRFTSIDHLIIPAIHCWLTAWGKNKLRGRLVSVCQGKKMAATSEF